MRRLDRASMFEPVSAASLAAFRVAFGLVLVWEVQRYLRYGWIARYWVDPAINLPYEGFAWVRPLPEAGLVAVFAILAAAGAAIAVGLAVRLAAAVATVAFGYLFLLDAARYLNHFYLVLLLAFLLIIVPTDRAAAIGPWFRRRWHARPAGPGEVPRWALDLVRFQIAVPYLFGGIAKLNGDWLRGEPVRDWLASRDDLPVVGPLLRDEAAVALFAYGGLALDLLAPFALAWRRTRVAALLAVIAFHLINAWTFSIGIFPFLMIAASLVFLPADWPRIAWRRARGRPAWHGAAFLSGAALAYLADPVADPVPVLVTGVAFVVLLGEAGVGHPASRAPRAVGPRREHEVGAVAGHEGRGECAPAASLAARSVQAESARARTAVVAFVVVWVAVQTLVPFRHHLLPGDVAWNEAGHRFSWRMKLRSKSGDVTFVVAPPDGSWQVRGTFDDELASWQRSWVATRPYLTLRFAHHLADRFAEMGVPDVTVRAEGAVSLNGRPGTPLVDPEVDLAGLRLGAPTHGAWVLPLDEPLPARR